MGTCVCDWPRVPGVASMTTKTDPKKTDTTSLSKPQVTVLIVDDDSAISKILKAVLSPLGHEILCAENGFDALLQMRTRVPNLIISDLNMPVMSGFEFLSVVRRRFPEIPV